MMGETIWTSLTGVVRVGIGVSCCSHLVIGLIGAVEAGEKITESKLKDEDSYKVRTQTSKYEKFRAVEYVQLVRPCLWREKDWDNITEWMPHSGNGLFWNRYRKRAAWNCGIWVCEDGVWNAAVPAHQRVNGVLRKHDNKGSLKVYYWWIRLIATAVLLISLQHSINSCKLVNLMVCRLFPGAFLI